MNKQLDYSKSTAYYHTYIRPLICYNSPLSITNISLLQLYLPHIKPIYVSITNDLIQSLTISFFNTKSLYLPFPLS